MLFTDNTDRGSLPELFALLHERFGDRLIAVGRPEPAVDGVQYAHVKIAYTGPTGAHSTGRFANDVPVAIVHTASLQDDHIVLGNGHYDLTPAEAWRLVR